MHALAFNVEVQFVEHAAKTEEVSGPAASREVLQPHVVWKIAQAVHAEQLSPIVLQTQASSLGVFPGLDERSGLAISNLAHRSFESAVRRKLFDNRRPLVQDQQGIASLLVVMELLDQLMVVVNEVVTVSPPQGGKTNKPTKPFDEIPKAANTTTGR
jgi:hypothetical protein